MNDIPSRSWLSPNVTVRKSRIHNLGLFANAAIAREETVAILGGTTLTDREVDEKMRSDERYDGVALDRNKNLNIAPRDWPGIYGNHSCDPNLWMKGRVTIIARRDVRPGEELTTDYAMYTISPGWSMECNCGSSLCRRVITGNDWKLPELRARYRGHFSPVIENLIEEEKNATNPRQKASA
jgi:uncharacterized protein